MIISDLQVLPKRRGFMKKIEQYKTTVRFTAITILCLFLTAIYYLVWSVAYNPDFDNPYHGKGQLFLVFIYFVVLIVTSIILGASRIDELRKSEIIFYEVFAILFANGIAYTQICLVTATLANVVPLLYILIAQLLVLIIWTGISFYFVHRLNPPEKMMIIYGSHLATEIVYKMSQLEDRFVITESANVDVGFDELTQKIDKFESIIICDVPARMRNDLLKYCYQQNKSIYVIPKISDIVVRSAADISYFDSPIIKCRSVGLTVEQRAIKRLVDIVCSLLALIVLSPMFIVISLAIKLYDGGPVFYKQKRCTRDLKTFDILKFRSMIVDAEKNGPQPAVDNDSRITPVGKVIRALRVDELPQILNILRGDMSIVGPRPERIEHVEKYSDEIPEFVCRYKVKGGLTGYAQVYGKYNTSAYNKLKMDLIYIQNYSLAMDFKLILMTVRILFKKDSTEGFDDKRKKVNK